MRLIDADALMEDIRKNSESYFADDFAHEWVDRQPTVKSKQGKWQWTKHYTWECSECHENPTQGTGYVQRETELFPFCPHCGARMIQESEITCLHSDREIAQSLVDDLNSLTEEQWAELESARMVEHE